MLYDSASLLSTLKLRGTVPAAAGAWTDSELLRATSQEIEGYHLPLLVQAKGEYLVKTDESVALVAGQEEYLLSYRAAAVRVLSLKRADGTELPIEELSPASQPQLRLNRTTRGVPRVFTFREGYVQLYPLPDSSSMVLRAKWHIRPNILVVTTDCRQVVSKAVDTPSAGLTRLTFGSAVPSALAGAAGTLYDFVGVRHPFPIKAFDVASQGIVTNAVSTSADFLTSALPPDLVVGSVLGDWLCAAQYTPMPNIPSELHKAAALRGAAAAIGSKHDSLRDQLLGEAAMAEQALLNGILAPRTKGNMQRLSSPYWRR